MSKPRQKGASPNPFGMAMPGMDAFSNLGNLMNFDPSAIDKQLNNMGDDDIDDDELERELLELNSNNARKVERRVQKPEKKIQDLNKINIDKLLGDDEEGGDDDDDIDENELEKELANLSPVEENVVSKKMSPAVAKTAIKSNNNDDKLKKLESNLNSFNKKYNDAMSSNDATKSKRMKRIVDQYNGAIKAYKSGSDFDYEALPIAPELIDSSDTPPSLPQPTKVLSPVVQPQPTKVTAPVVQPPPPVQQARPSPAKTAAPVDNEESEERQIFKTPEPAKTTLGVLDQLRDEFDKKVKQAEETNDSSKKRRYERSLKQVEAAIKATKLNKPFDYNELTPIIPPGFAQIPLINGQPVTEANLASAAKASPPKQQKTQAPAPAPVPAATKVSGQKNKQNDQNLKELRERQRLFKEAAIEAKKKGDDKVAIIYLKNAKGFDQMIIAAENGLPLDMMNLPKPPQMTAKLHETKVKADAGDDDFEIINEPDDIGENRDEVFKRLELDLRNQIKLAHTNTQYFTNLGDVANTSKFRNIENESLKDLNGLISAMKHSDPIPKYHYEKRKYQIINSCVELNDNDCELTIIRGINLPIPPGFEAKNLQTFIKYEFPYPVETPQCDKSSKQTGNNPEYNQVYKLEIQRKQTKFLRVMNRKELKIEVYYKAGLLKGDKLLATASVKLAPLEEKCEIHEAVELFDGRKPTNGKIEVKVRVRDPFVHKEVKIFEEKWLIIDKFITGGNSKTQATSRGNNSETSTSSNNTISKLIHALHVKPEVNFFDDLKEIYSLEILNFDRNLIEKQIETYKDRLNGNQLHELMEKSENLNQILISIKEKLKTGGKPGFLAYLTNISTLPQKYGDLGRQCQAAGDENKAMLHLKRKQIVESEIAKIKSRLN